MLTLLTIFLLSKYKKGKYLYKLKRRLLILKRAIGFGSYTMHPSGVCNTLQVYKNAKGSTMGFPGSKMNVLRGISEAFRVGDAVTAGYLSVKKVDVIADKRAA
jgi:hypothetical protein